FENFAGTGGVKADLTAAGFNAKLATGGTGRYVVSLDGNTFSTGSIAAPTTLADLATALNAVSGVSDLGTFSANGTALDFDATAFGAFATSTINSQGFTTNVTGGPVSFTGTAGTGYTSANGNEQYTLTVGSQTFVTDADTGNTGLNNKAVAGLMQQKLQTEGITAFTIGTAGNHTDSAITLTYASSTGAVAETSYTFVKTAGDAAAAASGEGTQTTIDVSSANDAITTIDAALATVASERASLGATQAQLESTVRNLANVAENTSAAAGRIMDTDYAAETANLTKAQILQQAATSILAQANAQPQGVLALLR
ncbi:flagellin, partial [Luminiphilus sp.]|nr:flagellin [Luminiphilus sp.]